MESRACLICDKPIAGEYVTALPCKDGKANKKLQANYLCSKCWGRMLTPYLRSKV